MQGSTTNFKLGDLSVVGREIINSQIKVPKPLMQPGLTTAVDSSSAQGSSEGHQSKGQSQEPKKRFKAQTDAGLPID